jgi:hypothetical protein
MAIWRCIPVRRYVRSWYLPAHLSGKPQGADRGINPAAHTILGKTSLAIMSATLCGCGSSLDELTTCLYNFAPIHLEVFFKVAFFNWDGILLEKRRRQKDISNQLRYQIEWVSSWIHVLSFLSTFWHPRLLYSVQSWESGRRPGEPLETHKALVTENGSYHRSAWNMQ